LRLKFLCTARHTIQLLNPFEPALLLKKSAPLIPLVSARLNRSSTPPVRSIFAAVTMSQSCREVAAFRISIGLIRNLLAKTALQELYKLLLLLLVSLTLTSAK
jgi:hypothetical protein